MSRDEFVGIPPAERTADLGTPDTTTMRSIRDLFVGAEPLVETAAFDSVLDPQEIQIAFTDGVDGADWCRLDVTWYTTSAYRFHHVDSEGVNWRFDRHPNPHSPDRHFHPPPDAPAQSAADSCIRVEEPRLVARAVLKLWRRAYETGTHSTLNTATDPP